MTTWMTNNKMTLETWLFIDPDESPIKCTVSGKAGHNHRTCPNVAHG